MLWGLGSLNTEWGWVLGLDKPAEVGKDEGCQCSATPLTALGSFFSIAKLVLKMAWHPACGRIGRKDIRPGRAALAERKELNGDGGRGVKCHDNRWSHALYLR